MNNVRSVHMGRRHGTFPAVSERMPPPIHLRRFQIGQKWSFALWGRMSGDKQRAVTWQKIACALPCVSTNPRSGGEPSMACRIDEEIR
jgi:hypothetical protein